MRRIQALYTYVVGRSPKLKIVHNCLQHRKWWSVKNRQLLDAAAATTTTTSGLDVSTYSAQKFTKNMQNIFMYFGKFLSRVSTNILDTRCCCRSSSSIKQLSTLYWSSFNIFKFNFSLFSFLSWTFRKNLCTFLLKEWHCIYLLPLCWPPNELFYDLRAILLANSATAYVYMLWSDREH